ncbi:hypothetical protein CD29_08130 [Ureibacillus manganicus DSM 26584]|uniref:Schlafen AlbA-2 domain-containing protein n=1 Tax=Ureibacillus manganicus DSM 26584 TaxID=1384049 RepID=A0A0A3I629_9BACL|nr:hypothetical protein CD29_08130 [Ureibacillus manganicus DSM 26584]
MLLDILQIIKAGETNTVEFKSWIKTPKFKEMIELLVKEAVGFANTKGGTILVGVEDDGEITGCSKFDTQNIIEAIYDKTIPKLFTDIEVIELEGKEILCITVDKSTEIISTSNGITYRRLGKNTKPYYPSEYSSNKIEGYKGDFSAKVIGNSSEDDIDFLEVENLKRKLQSREKDSTLYNLDDLSFLKDIELIKIIDNEVKLTVAGVLFVGTETAIAKYMPQAEILVLTYKEGKTEYHKRLDLKIPLVRAIDRIQQLFEDQNSIENVQVGLFKLEVQDYPINVFQEALLNAMTHRDYENTSSIIIKFYPTEIVIENPGSFPEGIDSKNIISHPSTPRNKLIAEIFQKLKYVQRSGQGVDIMFKDMLALGKSAPDYTLYNNAVKLILRSSLEDVEFLKFITKEEERIGEFTVQEICILKYVKEYKTISLPKAAEVAQINKQSVASVLSNLSQKKNILQREKRNSYMFTHRVYAEFDDQIEYIKDKDFDEIQAEVMIIDYLKKNGTITRADVEVLCGFSNTTSKRVLRKLRSENKIELVGKSTASKYVLFQEN